MKAFLPAVALLCLAATLAAKELPLPAVPSDLRTPAARADYVGAHFWDAMDFTDTTALEDEYMAQNVANFLSVFPIMSGDSARHSAFASAIKASGIDKASAPALAQTIENYLFDAASPMRDEKLFVIFLEEMLRAGTPDSVRTQWLLEMTAKNMEGTKCADFTFIDRKNCKRSLYECLGKPTILFFYDPDCDICHAAADEMAHDNLLSTRIDQGRAAIIAINPGELEPWKESRPIFPESWTDGCDNGKIDTDELYMISEFPEFYLLAPDGTVLLKDAPLPDIVTALMRM